MTMVSINLFNNVFSKYECEIIIDGITYSGFSVKNLLGEKNNQTSFNVIFQYDKSLVYLQYHQQRLAPFICR